ncbi:GMC oxidoreductase [Bryobacter aggregatus]|uniref:GMC oxidoreductase n=1 Tax=Bryobacter aggregatus TaxID=360054 RepID=UPI0004E17251|nr:GMC family oxidoreductase [Bryobacter aggregatus]
MAAQDYDVLIIGSGASGGMSAYTLTKLGLKCVMVEAGPLVDFDRARGMKPVYELPYRGFGKPGRLPHVLQANEFNANQWVDEKEVPYTHDPKDPYNWVRVRMVGGKSLFWARMSFRLSDYEFKAKDHDGYGENWPISYADLAPFYDRVDPIFRVSGRKEGLKQLPDGLFIEDESPDSTAAKRLAVAGKPEGMTITKIRRSLGNGNLASSRNLLLPDAVATGNLTIIPNAVAREISIDKNTGKANGLHFVDRKSRREMHVKAKVVVVAASCLESTRLLLNSKIANSSGVLGRYLCDQMYISNSVVALIPEAKGGKAPRGMVGGGGYIPRFANLNKGKEKNYIRGCAFDFSTGGTPDLKFFPGWGKEAEDAQNEARGAGFSATAMGEALPRYENHVRIDKSVVDAYGIPVLNFQVKYGDNDTALIKDSVATLAEVCRKAGFEVIHTNDTPFPPGYSIHEVGTCRMGDDPKKSVLNKWNQSHDIKNLFVVDGSSFVTAGTQNPTMTICALSMRASEYLADKLGKKEI